MLFLQCRMYIYNNKKSTIKQHVLKAYIEISVQRFNLHKIIINVCVCVSDVVRPISIL